MKIKKMLVVDLSEKVIICFKNVENNAYNSSVTLKKLSQKLENLV